MNLPIYQVDAFTSQVFKGNPAAVCPLKEWLPTEIMQSIALKNNLSETAFFVGDKGKYKIRWFTPAVEIELCGHATLGSAFIIFNHIDPACRSITFDSASGKLEVTPSEDLITLDFPARQSEPIKIRNDIVDALGVQPVAMYNSKRHLVHYENQQQVQNMTPDFSKLKSIDDVTGVIVTAAGREVDFVSRFFGPALGIDEDPVTGSAHCSLVPFWAEKLKKNKLHALQLSARGGELWCELRGDRVLMSGKAVLYMKGSIYV